MRVLISSTSGYGHVLPLVPLARALVQAGHSVLWATADEGAALVSAAGLQTTTAGRDRADLAPALREVHRAAGELPPGERRGYVFPKLFGRIRAPVMAPDLLREATRWRPDLLLHEHGELAAPLVAAVLGIPSVVQGFGAVVPPGPVAAAAEEVAPLWASYGLDVPAYAGCYEYLYLDIYPQSMQRPPMTHIRRIQPLRPVPYTGEGPRELRLPPGDAPLVYVTLGTVFNASHVLREVLRGVGPLDVRVVATVGPEGDVAAVGDQPPHVLVERFVSQTALLPHCAAVLSHCGSGTMLGALTCGLPQLCLPQAADQFDNASAVVAAGAGLALKPAECTAAALGAATASLLSDPRYRLAAQRLSGEIAAMPSPEDVVPVLTALAG